MQQCVMHSQSGCTQFCYIAIYVASTVELPLFDTISALYGVVGEVAVVLTFPILSSAKAQCEVVAELRHRRQVHWYWSMMMVAMTPLLTLLGLAKEVYKLFKLALTSGLLVYKEVNLFHKILRIA